MDSVNDPILFPPRGGTAGYRTSARPPRLKTGGDKLHSLTAIQAAGWTHSPARYNPRTGRGEGNNRKDCEGRGRYRKTGIKVGSAGV